MTYDDPAAPVLKVGDYIWTNNTFRFLGDEPGKPAPFRRGVVLDQPEPGDKWVVVSFKSSDPDFGFVATIWKMYLHVHTGPGARHDLA